MTEEQVEEVARGRVWTGGQALEIGLVDELGDFETALARAKELAGFDPEEKPSWMLVRVPRQSIPPDQLPGPDAARAMLWSGVSAARVEDILDVSRTVAREHVWALAPFLYDVGIA